MRRTAALTVTEVRRTAVLTATEVGMTATLTVTGEKDGTTHCDTWGPVIR